MDEETLDLLIGIVVVALTFLAGFLLGFYSMLLLTPLIKGANTINLGQQNKQTSGVFGRHLLSSLKAGVAGKLF